MKVRTILVDNDLGISSEIANLLMFYQGFEIVGEFADVNEAHRFLNENAVDAMFVSRDVGDSRFSGDGSFLVSYMAMRNPDMIAVMYGREEGDCYRCMCNGATAFFTLPIESHRFTRVVQQVTHLTELIACRERSRERCVMIKTKRGHQMVRLSEVLFIERSNRRISIHCAGGQEIPLTGYSMEELEQILSGSNFYRCYQSFLVNLDRVSFVKANSDSKSYALLLEGFAGEVILSRKKYNETLEILKDRYVKMTI